MDLMKCLALQNGAFRSRLDGIELEEREGGLVEQAGDVAHALPRLLPKARRPPMPRLAALLG